MSTPGWYPDPGGEHGRYRFWDGETWSPLTSTSPGGTTPGPAPGSGPAPRGRPRRTGVVLAVVAGLLVLGLVVAFVVRGTNRPIIDYGPSPTSTSGVDASPSATPSDTPSDTAQPSPSDSPSDTPGAVPSEAASATPCPIGNPFARQDYAQDGRVHGGALSFPRQAGWENPGQQVSSFTWAYDLGETDVQVGPRWYASYAVGAVSVADGFEDPRTAAALAMRCSAESALYGTVTSRTDLVDEETTVDGHRAWTLRSELRVDDDRTTFEGDTVEITVVDLDSPEALAFFWGCAPIGDQPFTDRLDAVVQQLRVG